MTESLAAEPTPLGRLGMSIPMLLPALLVTYPLRWLLARQVVLPDSVGLPLWVTVTLAFAFAATHPDRDNTAPIVFAAVVAGVFFVAQDVFGPPVPPVHGKPVYLVGPVLNAVGAVLLGYLAAYRDGVEAVRGLLTADRRRSEDAHDDS
jgi:uncharacterized membrane protein YeiH